MKWLESFLKLIKRTKNIKEGVQEFNSEYKYLKECLEPPKCWCAAEKEYLIEWGFIN